MRLNQYLARATGLSRRQADSAISAGRVSVNGQTAVLGQTVEDERIELDSKSLALAAKVYLALNKPVGFVCSRAGQGAQTIYDLLPAHYQQLKSVGRLDKDSHGLLLLTNDGQWAQTLSHPTTEKAKTYITRLNRPISDTDIEKINAGVQLSDGLSKFDRVERITNNELRITMHEGRNRQIRRTFAALGYNVKELERIQIGQFVLEGIKPGTYREIQAGEVL